MIVHTPLAGGYVWIEHDDAVLVPSRIYVLHTQAPGHASFALGSAIARDVGLALVALTEEHRAPDSWRRRLLIGLRANWWKGAKFLKLRA